MTLKQLFRDARKVIQKRGWCQGNFVSDNRVCLMGALRTVLTGVPTGAPQGRENDLYAGASMRLQKHSGNYSMVAWNDTPGRIQDEVLALLRKAERLAPPRARR